MKLRMTYTFFPEITSSSTIMFFTVMMAVIALPNDVFAITNEALRAPMETLKSDVFDWMFAVKVAAGVTGGVFSLVKQSPIPFGAGIGAVLGITFFDKYLTSSAAAALIG